MKVYGIKSCDSCRRALSWLDEAGVAYQWHDLREQAPDRETVRRWIEQAGREKLVNRRSNTWRGLDEQQRARADSDAGAIELLLENPTLAKRPVIDTGEIVLIGFTDQTGTTLLKLP